MTKTICTLLEHCFVNMTASTVRNMEVFLSLKEELQTMKNKGQDKLAVAIQKRKEIEEHLNLLITTVKATMEEIQDLQDENNLLMTELVSMLDSNSKEDTEETKDFLSELNSIVCNSSPDDSIETLKLKLKKSTDLCETNLQVATATASHYERCKKIRISVHLFDEEDRPMPTCNWLEDGFRLMNKDGTDGLPNTEQNVRQDLMLISHTVFSLLKKKNVGLGQQVGGATALKSKVVSLQLAKSLPSLLDADVALPSTSLLPARVPTPLGTDFVLGESIFIFRLAHSSVPTAEMHIRPVTNFYPEFINKLGRFCYKCPRTFAITIEKVIQVAVIKFVMKR